MDISIQQPIGNLPGIWISGLTQDQKRQIKQYITARVAQAAYVNHSERNKVKRCGPFFQIDYDDILFIELWIHHTRSEQERNEWTQELFTMLKEQFKDWIV